jgi:hypothetical protein
MVSLATQELVMTLVKQLSVSRKPRKSQEFEMSLPSKPVYLSASALLLLFLGGAWLWTRTPQKAEISGKDVQAAAHPEKKTAHLLKSKDVPAHIPSVKSGAQLQAEYQILLNTEPLKSLRSLDFHMQKNRNLLRQASHSPEFRRWREIVKETIAAGSVPHTYDPKAYLWTDMPYHFYQIELLIGLSRLDGAETDPEALHDAFKLNRALCSTDSWEQQSATAVCEASIQDRIAENLEDHSLEAMRDYVDLLQENAVSESRDLLVLLKSHHETLLDKILEDPERVIRPYRENQNEARALQDFFSDSSQTQELQQTILSLDAKLENTWKSGAWQQRLQGLQDCHESLRQHLEGHLPQSVAKNFVRAWFCHSKFELLADARGHRQALEAALRVEQFRREQGRLPDSLEEAGWKADSDPITLSYEVKEGKAKLSTPPLRSSWESSLCRDSEGNTWSISTRRPFKVKW